MNWIFIIALILGAMLFSQALGAKSYAPWVPSRRRDLARVCKLAGLKPGEIFYDLGCGDGRVVLAAAQGRGVRAVGFEYSLPFYLICKFRQLFNLQANASFRFKNFYRADLSQADVLYCFGVPHTLRDNLKPKLLGRLKPGARVISYAFLIEGLRPEAIDRPSAGDLPIYLYKF